MTNYTEGWDRIFAKEIPLSKKQFDNLLDYSTSIPTGTTIGKQWKRQLWDWEFPCPSGNGTGSGNRVWSGKWQLVEYTWHKDPNLVGIKYKNIIIVS